LRWFIGILGVLVIGAAIYVGSAVVSLRGLVDAARAGDAPAVLARTDVARLRRSLVDQIVSAYLKHAGRDRPIKPLERLAANTYGASVADAMIAKMLTEENLTNILSTGAVNSGSTAIGHMPPLSELDTWNIFGVLKRITLIKAVEFAVHIGSPGSQGSVSLHFSGTEWKLSGIQLPDEVVDALARNLINRKGDG
jgi:hypothetical protein